MKAPKGYTYDACPGCGEKPEDHRPRRKDGVCASCRAILDAHSRDAKSAQLVGDDAPLRYGVPPKSYRLPYMPHDAAPDFGAPKRIQHAFWTLVIAASAQAIGEEQKAPEDSLFDYNNQPPSMDRFFPYRPEEFRMLKPSIATAIRELYIEVQNGMGRSHDEGKGKGTNLLAMLSAGELTTADFERRAGITGGRGAET